MRLYRSTSIRRVILIGFSLVALPLILALITALISVNRLTTQGQQAIFAATDMTKASRRLVEDITAMERHVRQFQVLKDPALYRAYLERHRQFRENAEALLQRDISALLRFGLETLLSDERALFSALSSATPGSPQAVHAIEQFPTLSAVARTILSESSQLVGREAENIQRAAAETQRLLLWQTLALIVLAFVLAGVFTILIARPIKQINHAIRQLGDGEFSTTIRVAGPQDLENLGQRLDWLRLRLLQLEQQKITFLRHISHELKTPLAAIREGVGLLKERVVGTLNGEQAEVAQILHQNSLQLQKLIEDLISFSIAQVPAPFTERRPVQLHRMLEKLVNNQKLAVKMKNISFDMDIAEATVIGDQEKLGAIFDNLLSNAIKYTPSGGKIKIALRRDAGCVAVDVCDEGPGIDSDEREKIFEAFYQGRAIAKGHVKGSGLGLSIAYQYVKSHAGNIEVLDAARGAHIHVTLPLAAETGPSYAPTKFS